MIIAKAIEILQLNVDEAGQQMPADTLTALKLGIEALKRIEYVRIHPWSEIYAPLPGETMPEKTW